MEQAEPIATRRELDMLRTRVDLMDVNGTRGVILVQERLADVAKDVAKLEGQMAAHELLHERDRKERVSGRRWLAGTVIAALAAMVAILALLVDITSHLR